MEKILQDFRDEMETAIPDFREFRKDQEVLLKKYSELLKDNESGLQILRLEHELYNLHKSVEEGLRPSMSGTKEEDGKEVETRWPDYTLYGNQEYQYIQKRYTETNNLFLKTEYGLMLFLNRKLQHPNDRKALCNSLIQLITKYKDKIHSSEDSWAIYVNVFYTRLVDVLCILSRAGEPLKTELDDFIKLIQDWFLNWPVDHKAFVSFSQFIATTFVDYHKHLQTAIDPQKVIDKLDAVISHYKPIDTRLAVMVSEKALLFNSKYKLKDNSVYNLMLAQMFEAQGDEELKTGRPFGAAKEYEDSLLYYTEAKDNASMERVSQKYEENKGQLKMGTVEVATDEEQSKQLTEAVNKVIEKNSPELILLCMCGNQIFVRPDALKQSATDAAKGNSIMNFVSLSSVDKFGNTLKVYATPEERYQYHLSQQLHLTHQVGVQIIWEILKRALKKEIISFEFIKKHLENSWIGEPIEFPSGGKQAKVVPLNAIIPGVKNFFDEMDLWLKSTDGYRPNFILCSDSMATKIEMLLRYMSKKIGIPTFAYREENGFMLSDEKPLSKLLEGLKSHLDEHDVILIKHLLNEKGGLNIRNAIAHGLKDAHEYDPQTPITLMAVIFRLSMYKVTGPEE